MRATLGVDTPCTYICQARSKELVPSACLARGCLGKTARSLGKIPHLRNRQAQFANTGLQLLRFEAVGATATTLCAHVRAAPRNRLRSSVIAVLSTMPIASPNSSRPFSPGMFNFLRPCGRMIFLGACLLLLVGFLACQKSGNGPPVQASPGSDASVHSETEPARYARRHAFGKNREGATARSFHAIPWGEFAERMLHQLLMRPR